ncbi:MAG: NADH-quinone oxidoreductase subunit J [Anaerolineae bacterium]|nr:NADH-quinone oxidoreductase subunit J [Anaerolineae bacterium]
MDLILFLILAVVAIATALGMLVSRNAVYSALFLVLNFATVAVFYLLLGAPFIALTQVTVYAGAIMVLFLFVIMLLGTDELPERKVLNWQKPMAIFLALVLMAEGVYLIFIQKSASGLINNSPGADFGSPQAIGDLLFTDFLLPFEVTSILLLVAMVGAIVLTGNKKGGQS